MKRETHNWYHVNTTDISQSQYKRHGVTLTLPMRNLLMESLIDKFIGYFAIFSKQSKENIFKSVAVMLLVLYNQNCVIIVWWICIANIKKLSLWIIVYRMVLLLQTYALGFNWFKVSKRYVFPIICHAKPKNAIYFQKTLLKLVSSTSCGTHRLDLWPHFCTFGTSAILNIWNLNSEFLISFIWKLNSSFIS